MDHRNFLNGKSRFFQKPGHLVPVTVGGETTDFYYPCGQGIFLVQEFDQRGVAAAAGLFVLGPQFQNAPPQGVLGHEADH